MQSGNNLSEMNPEEQSEFMREWFLSNYQDPVHSLPHDSGDGGYVWLDGGPFDAHDVLNEQFGEVVHYEVINSLAESLEEECTQWTPIIPRD